VRAVAISADKIVCDVHCDVTVIYGHEYDLHYVGQHGIDLYSRL